MNKRILVLLVLLVLSEVTIAQKKRKTNQLIRLLQVSYKVGKAPGQFMFGYMRK